MDAPPATVRRPLLALAVAFLLGAAAGLREPGQPLVWPWLAGLALAGAVVGRGRGRVALLAGLLAAVGLGGWRAETARTSWERQPLRRWTGRTVALAGQVVTPPEARRGGGERVLLQVTAVEPEPGRSVPVAGRVSLASERPLQVAYGDRVRVVVDLAAGRTAGNPGEFSRRRQLERDGLAAEAWCVEPPRLIASEPGPRLGRWSASLRHRLGDAIRRTMPGPAPETFADLLCAMVFGVYAAPVDPALEAACRRTGVVHVLVASGTQVSLLLIGLWWLGRLLPLPRSVVWLAAGVVVGSYCLVTGFGPAIVRAAVMGLIVFGALAFGQDYDLPTSLGVAAAVMVAARPSHLTAIGFQLSFAATAGLIFLGLPLARRLETRWPRPVAGLVALTLGAQLCVAPLLVWHFHQLSLVGLLANLPVIPLSGALVVLGLTASALGCLVSWPAILLNHVSHALLTGFVALVGWFDRRPWAQLEAVPLTPGQLTLWLGLLSILALALGADEPRWPSRLTVRRAGLVLLAGVTCWIVADTARLASAKLEVAVLDVGHGDSLLLTSPTGRRVLVDGGPYREFDGRVRDAGAEQVVPTLLLRGVRRLDAVIGSHAHADHLGGLVAVLEAFACERLLLPETLEPTAARARLTAAAEARGLVPERLRRGDRLDLGGGARLYVLWPPPTPVGGTGSDENNNAVVLKLVYGRISFLLASDLEAAGEEFLLRHAGDLAATVLKVPHQGAADSCSDEFLAAVAPEEAVIACGPNNYGHPSPATLERLRRRQIVVRRTDRAGQVTYRTDGRTLSVAEHGRR